MTIAIRVDGNSEIATGHIMRCLAIANGLKKKGHECRFIVADDNSELLLSNLGFPIINLHSAWNHLESELSELTEVILQNKIHKLIVDTYFVTDTYLSALEKICKVIYIDDLNSFRYPVSVVVNYNLYGLDIPYSKIYLETNTKLLLGPKYAPLREEFQNINASFRNTVQKILITAGGADTYNAAGQIIAKVVADVFFKGIEFHVVAGRLNSHIEELKTMADTYPSIVIHQNVHKMSELMLECDIAVTAGGSTMYELCACGVPSICFSWANNQLSGVKAFSERELMKSAGDIRDNREKCIQQIIVHLKDYITNTERRKIHSSNLRKITDGYGAKRLADAIVDISLLM